MGNFSASGMLPGEQIAALPLLNSLPLVQTVVWVTRQLFIYDLRFSFIFNTVIFTLGHKAADLLLNSVF